MTAHVQLTCNARVEPPCTTVITTKMTNVREARFLARTYGWGAAPRQWNRSRNVWESQDVCPEHVSGNAVRPAPSVYSLAAQRVPREECRLEEQWGCRKEPIYDLLGHSALGHRAGNALTRAHITTIAQLKTMDDQDLRDLRNVGTQVIRYIRACLDLEAKKDATP